MKKCLILTVLLLSWGATALAETYLLDTDKSIIQWRAKEVTGERFGTVKFDEGKVEFEGENLTAGKFSVNMGSIEVLNEMPSKFKQMLTEDLKSSNFFDVEKYPISEFTVTKVKETAGNQREISGNLTIKGITQPITFPVQIRSENGMRIAEGKVTLDRIQWDIRYRSGKFFKDLGDKLIYDDFEIKLSLWARKK